MRTVWQGVKPFVIPHLALLVVGFFIVAVTDKHELHLWFNQWHTPFFDVVFKYATKLAEEWSIITLILLALIYKLRYGVAIGLGLAASGVTTQMLKRFVFADELRPMRVFEGIADLHFVEGVTLHQIHSFPSGHATAAFAIGLSLAFLLPKTWMKLAALGLSLCVAFSRVYLSQHFFEDILAGSVVGISIPLVIIATIATSRWGDMGLIQWVESRLKP